MTEQMLISALTGPTSSLLLLVGIGMAGWKFFSNTVVPATKTWVDKHLEQVDAILEQHEKDRDAWLTSMQDCHKRSDKLSSEIETVSRKVGGLYARHEALQTRLDTALTKPLDNGAA
jgi:hypothetical protein